MLCTKPHDIAHAFPNRIFAAIDVVMALRPFGPLPARIAQ